MTTELLDRLQKQFASWRLWKTWARKGRGNRAGKPANSSLISWRVGKQEGMDEADVTSLQGVVLYLSRYYNIIRLNILIWRVGKIFQVERRCLSHALISPVSREGNSAGKRNNFRSGCEISSMIGSDRHELLPGRNCTGTIAREIH